jgi:parvulin-like peptidyl-prolyl isomerase
MPRQKNEGVAMIPRALIFIILLSAVFCCAAAAPQNIAAAPQNNTAASSPPPAKTESDLVVLRVSGQPITENQVLQTINQLASQQVSADKGQKRKATLYNGAIENVIISALLKTQARLQNITIDNTLIDQKVQDYSKQFSSEEDFKKELAKQGTTELELRRNIEESMSVQKVLDLAVKDVPGATEEELMGFYNANLKQFDMPQRAIASHILLRVDSKSTLEQKLEIKLRLGRIRAEIENKTITFADAAKKYSQDSATAQKGGDLGIIQRGKGKSVEGSDQSIESAIFDTNPGAISPIIESPQGYHIIEVKEIKPAGKESFEDAKPAMREYLDKAAKQKAMQKFVQGLRGKATLELFMTEEEFFKRHPASSR